MHTIETYNISLYNVRAHARTNEFSKIPASNLRQTDYQGFKCDFSKNEVSFYISTVLLNNKISFLIILINFLSKSACFCIEKSPLIHAVFCVSSI